MSTLRPSHVPGMRGDQRICHLCASNLITEIPRAEFEAHMQDRGVAQGPSPMVKIGDLELCESDEQQPTREEHAEITEEDLFGPPSEQEDVGVSPMFIASACGRLRSWTTAALTRRLSATSC